MSFLENDDLYNFNQPSNILSHKNLEHDEEFQKAALQTAAGRRPPMSLLTSHGVKRYTGTSKSNRGTTAYQGFNSSGNADNRPMTSVKAAGFKRDRISNFSGMNSMVSGSNFDPMSGANFGMSGNNYDEKFSNKESEINKLEKEAHALLEESIKLASTNDLSKALDKAKEADDKEKIIKSERNNNSLDSNTSLDLIFSVKLNLALQYENNELWHDAINVYKNLTDNKAFENVGRIKVNIGNIYFKQKEYKLALKFYTMALDQITKKYNMLRVKIMKNIGYCYIKMGRYDDAKTSFEHIMSEKPDYEPGFQLILVYYTINDVLNMKNTFIKLLDVKLGFKLKDHRYKLRRDTPFEKAYSDSIKNDSLKNLENQRVQTARYYIISAAKLIAPKLDIEFGGKFGKGFDWCVEEVKKKENLDTLVNELEVEKTLALLRVGLPKKAEELLKKFEKKEETPIRAVACNNLSFMHLEQNNIPLAHKFADLALIDDKYNPAALVNKGNIFLYEDQIEEAIMLYREALNIDSTCIEALYNLALAYYQVGDFENAITTLHRLDQILPNQFTAMYLLAKCYVDVGNTTLALDWLQKCHDNFDFCDIEILQKIGNVADKEGDLTKAFSSYRDAHTKLPGDIDTIAWLGNYYINDTKFPEKALKYFKKAVLIQPNEVRWHLLVALCLNRDGKTQKAFQKYQAIHNQFPDNLDCLKRLVVMAEQLGDVELMKEYKDKIIRSEKQMVANQQNRINSGRIRSGRTENRSGSARNRVPSGHNRSNHPSGTLPSFTGNTATPSPLSTMNLSSNLPPTGRRGPEEQAQPTRELDTDFADPLANQMSMRPKTAKNKNAALAAMQDNVEDYDVDDLLPD